MLKVCKIQAASWRVSFLAAGFILVCGRTTSLANFGTMRARSDIRRFQADGFSIKVKILHGHFDASPFSRWGTRFGSDCSSRVFNISIERTGKSEFGIPASSYSDLDNIDRVSIVKKTGKRFMLKMTGGDAMDGYNCILEFDGQLLIRRTVKSREMPIYWNESTLYDISIPD